MSQSLTHTLATVLLFVASLTCATDAYFPKNQRERRQILGDVPSWTTPSFCTETGRVKDIASLMLHPPPSPPSKTPNSPSPSPSPSPFPSLCSEILRPTHTITYTSTLIGSTPITLTSTTTLTISTTTSEYSHSTTTALCPLPYPSPSSPPNPSPATNLKCSLPALGLPQNLLYFKNDLSGIQCHELCLADTRCLSFQVVVQTDRLGLELELGSDGGGKEEAGLRYLRCNVYKTRVEGNVVLVDNDGDGGGEGDGDEFEEGAGARFWDRGCAGLVAVSFEVFLPVFVMMMGGGKEMMMRMRIG
ncbi:hypothetical protein ONS95_005294 [Cadophora gregata]|uniref:uncharacterized protein n=1 Tax=Cadophora gregata TaxID=51156 RepID=UPI0026DD5B06|nr:uncharacterized protein ONS95_005294 [Cadophora gregata]KAK0103260.1 hypothetical protein ONS95_005294 [Cadophora gregata]